LFEKKTKIKNETAGIQTHDYAQDHAFKAIALPTSLLELPANNL